MIPSILAPYASFLNAQRHFKNQTTDATFQSYQNLGQSNFNSSGGFSVTQTKGASEGRRYNTVNLNKFVKMGANNGAGSTINMKLTVFASDSRKIIFHCSSGGFVVFPFSSTNPASVAAANAYASFNLADEDDLEPLTGENYGAEIQAEYKAHLLSVISALNASLIGGTWSSGQSDEINDTIKAIYALKSWSGSTDALDRQIGSMLKTLTDNIPDLKFTLQFTDAVNPTTTSLF